MVGEKARRKRMEKGRNGEKRSKSALQPEGKEAIRKQKKGRKEGECRTWQTERRLRN